MKPARWRAEMNFQFEPQPITLMVEKHVERIVKAAMKHGMSADGELVCKPGPLVDLTK